MPEIPSREDRVTLEGNYADAPIGEVPMNIPSRNDGETTTCACGVCGRQFQPVGRQRFYDAACRQKAWRRRHPPQLPAIPARVPRVATVYVCTECDTRYLGEQYCGDCGTFCKRVGAGGSCPHCGEAVAVADLIE
jgi:hypothetical protein